MFATLDDLDGQVELLVFEKALAERARCSARPDRAGPRHRRPRRGRQDHAQVSPTSSPFDPSRGRDRARRREGGRARRGPRAAAAAACASTPAGSRPRRSTSSSACFEDFPGESEVVLEVHTRTGLRRLRLRRRRSRSPAATPRCKAELDRVLGAGRPARRACPRPACAFAPLRAFARRRAPACGSLIAHRPGRSARRGPCPCGRALSSTHGRPSKRGSDRNARQPSRADLAVAEVDVAVAVGAERRRRVVDVQRAEPGEPDDAVELVEHARPAPPRCGCRSPRRAGGRSPGRRRAARPPPAASTSRASSSNERPSVPPAPAVSSRCSGHLSLSFHRLRDHLSCAVDRLADVAAVLSAEPGCRTTACAPSSRPRAARRQRGQRLVADLGVLGRAVEQVDGVDQERVDVRAPDRLVVRRDPSSEYSRGFHAAGSG